MKPDPDHDSGHCHGPECFQGAEPIDICACDCPACVEAREALLREQGEGDEPDPSDPAGSPGH